MSENGFGKRTDVDMYRLQTRGGKGVINMRTTPKIGPVNSINLVDETTEMMVISQFGKIIRIDTKTVRATMGVKLLDLDTGDKVAAAMVIPPKTRRHPRNRGRCYSSKPTNDIAKHSLKGTASVVPQIPEKRRART